MKVKRFILLWALLAVLFVGMAVAQDAEAVTFDPALVQVILLTGIGGMGVAALTELVKRWLGKLLPMICGKLLGYASSLLVSAAAVAAYFIAAGSFAWVPFIIYTVAVFGLANGFYKMQPKPDTN